MKNALMYTLTLLLGLWLSPTVQAESFNDGWTMYSSDNYRGGRKMMKAGDYDRCNSWRYYSWKADDYCCITFYFYYRNGKKGEKQLCGSVKDLRNEMRGWGDLKYGYNQAWKNVYKAEFACKGGNHQAGNNHNDRDNNYGGGGDNWKADYNRGKCVVWKGGDYRDDYYAYDYGKKYYPRQLKFHFWSLRIPRNYECYFVVKNKYGRQENYTLKGDIGDLKDYFRKWDLRDYNRGWDYVEYFEIRKAGSGNNHAGNNNDRGNNTGGGDNWKADYNRGKCVVWKGGDYRDDYYAYDYGKKYYPRQLKFHFWSLRIPRNYECYFVVKNKYGRQENYTLKGDIGDLKDYFRKWDLRDYNRGWDYVEYFEIRKAGMGGNDDRYNGDDYRDQEWYKKYGRGGYIVFFDGEHYKGKYFAKPAGDYDPRRLVYPQSLYMSGTSLYLVLEYYDKRNRKESVVIKESIKDLNKFLYEKGVYRDYEKYPYKAITRLAVIRQ